MGRPKLPEDEARKPFPIRISYKEKAAFQRAATAKGQTLPDWVRKTLTEAAKET